MSEKENQRALTLKHGIIQGTCIIQPKHLTSYKCWVGKCRNTVHTHEKFMSVKLVSLKLFYVSVMTGLALIFYLFLSF